MEGKSAGRSSSEMRSSNYVEFSSLYTSNLNMKESHLNAGLRESTGEVSDIKYSSFYMQTPLREMQGMTPGFDDDYSSSRRIGSNLYGHDTFSSGKDGSRDTHFLSKQKDDNMQVLLGPHLLGRPRHS